jgi:hypothetical protein
MKEHLRSISAPELRSVVMLATQITNDLPNVPRPFNLSVNISQQVGVGVSEPTDAEPAAPVVTIEFQLRGSRADNPEAAVITADTTFLALFDSEGVSQADWVSYTSSPFARNIALQAYAACKLIFRGQLRLAGLQSEHFTFGKLGEFTQQQPATKLPHPPKSQIKRTRRAAIPSKRRRKKEGT